MIHFYAKLHQLFPNIPDVQYSMQINQGLVNTGMMLLCLGVRNDVDWDELIDAYAPGKAFVTINDLINESEFANEDGGDDESEDINLAIMIMLLTDPKNPLKFDWERMVEEEDLPQWFVGQFMIQLGFKNVFKYQKLTKSLMKFGSAIPWDAVSANEHITPAFINNHADKLDWEILSGNMSIDEKTLSKHSTLLFWEAVAHREQLSLKFIRKHISEFKHHNVKIPRKHVMDVHNMNLLELGGIPKECTNVIYDFI